MFCLQFLDVFGLDKGLQACEISAPEAAVLLDPGVNGAQWFRIELVHAMASLAVFAHQMRSAQEAEMLRDGGARDWESVRDLSGGLGTYVRVKGERPLKTGDRIRIGQQTLQLEAL